MGSPIEISHEEFIDLTKKHGKAAAGKVLEISEDEFLLVHFSTMSRHPVFHGVMAYQLFQQK
jgi:hypothetical protein